ncbi:SEC-C metal-binding domain-containing protein [Aeromicrobium sp.]|uniref:SEC-C metal-binding domain-containing protein n=1 Tax=Aeromicrobium sp. TaxID=1871063 RepID=UPI002FCACE65
MTAEFVELSRDERCPCRSGRKYGRCCGQKAFSFGRNAAGELVKQTKLVPEAAEIIRAERDRYTAYYGRPPSKEDLLFAFSLNPADSIYSLARDLLKHDVLPPDIIYAYCRSDGLMPVEGNLDVISDGDLAEFTDLRNEYDELAETPDDGSHPTAVWFVTNGNGYIGQVIQEVLPAVRMVLSDFLARHSEQGDFVDFQIKTPVDYANFSAHKSMKTIRTIEKLCEHSMPEAIYALTRGLLENYLYLNTIANDPTFFEQKVAPRADRANFAFAVKDGRIDYNRVIHQATGAEQSIWVTNRALLKHATATDRDLFDLFYQTACQFVHVDVLSARAYFHEADPFDELDPSSLATLVAAVLSGQLISALSRIPGVDARMPADAVHFLRKLSDPMSISLQLASSDPEHKNEVWAVLKRVVDSWGLESEVVDT